MNVIQPPTTMQAGGLRADVATATETYPRMNSGAANPGPGMADGLSARGWMNRSPSQLTGTTFGGDAGGSSASGSQGGFMEVINNLINQLGAFINGLNGETAAEGTGTQSVLNASFASTGDPHLSETGTVLDASGNSSTVNSHFDSMTGHPNLLSSQDFSGGYRLSTTVTAPNAHGVTLNASATVHLNGNQDIITLNADGSSSVTSDGNTVSLAKGQTSTLAGGENVTRSADGSLNIAAQSMYGGSISTTLAATGGGVNVTANVQNATVGGDIAGGIATAAPQRLRLENSLPNGFA